MTRYLDQPRQWDRMVELARTRKAVAIDTEYLINEKSSPAFHSAIHVWSLGFEGTGEANARGVIPAMAFVLPKEALHHPAIRAYLEDQACTKWAHNAGVDRHAMDNAGLAVMGVRDTLGIFRWLLPGRVAPGPGFSLDALGLDLLGHGKVGSFVDLVSRPRVVRGTKLRRWRLCTCGVEGCRLRSRGHVREDHSAEEPFERVSGVERFPLSDINPGHERWQALVEYAGGDVVVGSELVQWARAHAHLGNRKVPF